MNADKQQVLLNSLKTCAFSYYPRGLTWGDSDWILSDEIYRLITARRDASRNYRLWYGFQDFFKEEFFPELDFLAFADFQNDCCYILEVLLHPSVKFIHDDRAILQTLGGEMATWELYISCLGRWVYHHVKTMKVVDLAKDKFEFTTSQNYGEGIPKRLFEKYRAFWESKGYQDVPKELAMEIVPDVETECKPMGQATIFHCLFSDTTSP
jgi:hypothetical protein